MNTKAILAALLLVCMATTAYAATEEYISTPIYFYSAADVSLTVTLPGQAGVDSTSLYPVTGNLYFNSTTLPAAAVLPCVGIDGTNCQNGATPAFAYTSAANLRIDVYLRVNQTLPTGVTLWTNSTNGTVGTITGTDVAYSLNDTQWNLAANELATAGTFKVWVYANFTTAASSIVGTPSAVNRIIHNSTYD